MDKNNIFAHLSTKFKVFLSKKVRCLKRIVRFGGWSNFDQFLGSPEKAMKRLLHSDLSERRQLVQLSRSLGNKVNNVVTGFKGNLKSIRPEMISTNKTRKRNGQYNVLLKRGTGYVVTKNRSLIYSNSINFKVLYLTRWNISKIKLDGASYPLFKLNKLYRCFITQFSKGQFGSNCLKKVLGFISRKSWNRLFQFFRKLRLPTKCRKRVDKTVLFGGLHAKRVEPTSKKPLTRSTEPNPTELDEEALAMKELEELGISLSDDDMDEEPSIHASEEEYLSDGSF